MKVILTGAAAAMVLAGAVAEASASSRKSKVYRELHNGQRIYDDRDRFGWYPRDSNQLKFGSKIWFEQMEAEGRFGGRRRFGG